jgi:CDP-diacylglycerol--glycerol-3-phosphate 3-phosphatidyltransferase
MDPLADKILICAAFISFVAIQQIVPAWVVIAIVSREFLVTGLRLVAAGAGRILEAGRLGKHKMVWQIVVIVVVIAGLAVREDIIPRLPETDLRRNVTAYYSAGFNWLAYGLSSLTAVLTVISGVFYFWKNRELVIREM